jgi:uncharacterized membrane protein (UPF0182 family)
MESTLDAALDDLFGGDSGAPAGDANTSPTAPPTTPPGDGGQGDGGSTPTSTPTPTAPAGGAGTGNAAQEQAIKDAQQAFDDAQTALKNGDWAAYGQAQDRLQQALERAAAAEQQK